MKNSFVPGHRRKFIKQSMALVLSTSALSSFAHTPSIERVSNTGNDKKPPLAPELVLEFVRLAHFELPKVREMLEKEPALVNACWDWGGGDFETALGGPSHIGNQDIANYLLEKGARKDIYCASMLGDRELVQAFIKNNPAIANVDGPHHYSLMYHVAISGDIKMAGLVKPHVSDIADFNQALHSAVKNGKLEITEWLLNNGCNDLNTKDFIGSTPLQVAEKRGYKEIAEMLKKHGAM
ncbi:MAG: ankyrin repeat domain-containing protein [Chitinophagaceae bacterium]